MQWEKSMKAILVTGTSPGIRYSIAQEFARCGYRVFGSLGKEQDAERLKEIGATVIPLQFDVTDESAI